MTNQANIEQFTIAIPDVDLENLRQRLRRTRCPQHLPEAGWDFRELR
jgi:epoxide hydrolase